MTVLLQARGEGQAVHSKEGSCLVVAVSKAWGEKSGLQVPFWGLFPVTAGPPMGITSLSVYPPPCSMWAPGDIFPTRATSKDQASPREAQASNIQQYNIYYAWNSIKS